MSVNASALWWTDLKAVIQSTWGCTIERTPSLDRASIINLLKDGKKVAPFCVVEVGRQRSADTWGTMEISMVQPVSIIYFAKTDDPNAKIDPTDATKGYDIEQYVLNQVDAIRTALITADKQYMQLVPPWPSVNMESWASMNRTLLAAQYPYYAGKIEAELLIGSTIKLGNS